MNRHRQGGRDRRPNYGGGDGLLGEGPGFGGSMFEPMVNTQMNQLMLAQQLLQQQAALGGTGNFGGGGNDLGAIGALAGAMGNMQFLQHQQGMGYGGGIGSSGMRNDRKRLGGQGREMDLKRRRRDSSGRGGDRDRSRGRDSNRSGGEGRDRNHSSRWDSDRDRGRKVEDYDPAEPTEDEELKDKDSNLYCHVCNVSVYDDESFRRHLNGTKHNQRMNSVLTVHQMKSNQLNIRLKAEEHLRKIEGKGKSKRDGYDPNYFCKICNNSLTIPWERHRFSNIHKQRQLQVKRGCGWCNVHDFNNFTEVLEHRETEEHKKNAEQYGKRKDEKEHVRSRSRSRERRTEKYRKRSTSRDRSRRDKERKQKEREKLRKEEDEEDLTIPEYSAENPVGLNYIIPVTGFFCKLCHKFYNNEKSAKGAHCQSEAHYDKFKLATQAKIADREKRKADEAASEAEQKPKVENEDDTDLETKEDTKSDTDLKKDVEDDDEDYDDDLPLEDEDNDGGLVNDEDLGLLYDDEASSESKNVTASNSTLNDTNANSSFVYISGDMAEAHLELQRQENEQQAKNDTVVADAAVSESDESKELPAVPAAPDAKDKLESDVDLSGEVDEKEENTSATDLDNTSAGDLDNTSAADLDNTSAADLNDDEIVAASTPAESVKTAAKARGGGTARRGRGRGKAKK
ncbi:unnamed protein product [Lymnaea stagnalis]|uniref:Matrin-type domain-containing protein n=1 Tax=Lymnaea stagnalis TaxID=6523 RepID=A0AAV2IG65_LYMST